VKTDRIDATELAEFHAKGLSTIVAARWFHEVKTRPARRRNVCAVREQHAVGDSEGDIAFNVQHKRKIKQLQVSKALHVKLVARQLSIVQFESR